MVPLKSHSICLNILKCLELDSFVKNFGLSLEIQNPEASSDGSMFYWPSSEVA